MAAKAKVNAELVEVHIVKSLCGRFLLPQGPGQVLETTPELAAEIVEEGYGFFENEKDAAKPASDEVTE
jgi:hypothetical protein